MTAPARLKSPLSVVICAFNGLGYTKLLVESLRRYSTFDHEIVVWSDGSSDGTPAWLAEQKDILSHHDPVNRGICTAMNGAAALATRPYLFFPNTDHVLAPGWDEVLIRRLGPRTVVSFSCIEPGLVPVASIFHTLNLGARSDEFDWNGFESVATRLTRPGQVPGVNYPFALSRDLWNEVGALDTLFDPGPANDPDLFYRLQFARAEFVRAEDALAYHFSGKSSRMAGEAAVEQPGWKAVTDRNEARFEEKWGERYCYSNGGLPHPGAEARRRKFHGDLRPTPGAHEKKLRIAIDARAVSFETDGIGASIAGLIGALRRIPRIDLHVLVNDPRPLARSLGSLRGMTVRVVAGRPGSQDAEIVAAVRQMKPDVFHGPAFSLPDGLPCPAVVTVHDVAFELHPEWYPAPFVEHMRSTLRRALGSASRIVAVSERTRQDLVARCGVDPARIDVVPGAPSETVSARSESSAGGLPQGPVHGGKPYLLAIGMKQRRKNAVGLLRAFASLATRGRSQGTGLLMTLADACEDPRFEEERRRIVGELDFAFAGRLSDAQLERALAGASALVYPSLYEGFGLPLLDAMSRGVPVVCSDGGALAETAGDAALVVPAGNEPKLEAALESVLSDRELRMSLTRRGLCRALEFSWDRSAREMVGVYERAAAVVSRPVVPAAPRSLLRIAVDARMLVAPNTGTGRYTLEILRHLPEWSGDATFVLLVPGAPDRLGLPDSLKISQCVQAGPETLLNPAWEQFSSIASLVGCDAVFAPTGILATTRACPGIPVIHDLGFLDRPADYDPRLREHLDRWVRRSCLSAESLIAVSAATRDQVVRRFGVRQDRISVIHHGRTRRPAQTGPRKSPKNVVILCVSAFEPNKNQIVLLEALAAGRGKKTRLILAGRSGRTLEHLRRRARELGIERAVDFQADVDERRLASLYTQASVFAFPSLYEGFGLPLIEAMEAGLPVVASAIPSSVEVLAGAGQTLPADDVRAWSAALLDLVRNPGERRKVAKKCARRAEEFDWSLSARSTWTVILEATKRR